MRRQTQPMKLAARWCAQPLDLDPYRLPSSYALSVAGRLGRWLGACDHVALHGSRVTVTRRLLGIAFAQREFSLAECAGLAVRMERVGDYLAVSINLHHDEPELCVPLFIGTGMDQVGGRWQAFGRSLGLPLLVHDEDGALHPATPRLGMVAVGPSYPRRRSQMGRSRFGEQQLPTFFPNPVLPDSA